MPHNFRITGTRYVSKASVASDANAGTDPNLPKKTIAGGLSGLAAGSTLVVGTGVYKEAINFTINDGTIRSDGVVIFQGNGFNVFTYNAGGSNSNIRDIIFRGYLQLTKSAPNGIFNNCLFLCNVRNTSSATTLWSNFQNCIFFENLIHDFFNSTTTLNQIFKCICYKNASLTGGIVRNSFFFGELTLPSINSGNFSNNNIRGTVRFLIGGVEYAIRDQYPISSTPQDHGYAAGVKWATGAEIIAEIGTARGTAAQWDTAIATCINRDPKFNNPEKLDFTLKPDSPHIGRASDGTNIGGTNVAVSYYVDSLVQATSNTGVSPISIALESDSNLQMSVFNDIDIKDFEVNGKIKTGWFKINNVVKQIRAIRYIGNLNFNTDGTLPPNTENENVPAVTLYGAGTAGENPERLTVNFQWHTGESMPIGDTGNNGGLAPSGTFQPFLINQIPTIDNASITNGNPLHNPATASGINGIWGRLEITLNNNWA